MKNLILILLFSSTVLSQTVGTTSDGKTVIINDDGTWEILEVESISSYKEAFNMYEEGPWDYSDDYFDKDAPRTGKGVYQRDKYFKENLGHIMLDFNRKKGGLVPFVELFTYWSYIHYGGSYQDVKADFNVIGDINFGFFDFEDDGVNELVIEGSYRTAGYSGYLHVFAKVGNTNVYRQVLDFDSSGGFSLDTHSKLFYSIDWRVDYIICGACGYQILRSHYQKEGESNRAYKKRIETDPKTKFVSLYPNYNLNPKVGVKYKDGELFHPKQSFAKNTQYFDVMTFIKDEIDWSHLDAIEDISGNISYYFLNDNGTSEKLEKILSNWYRPLIQNIMAYHYNSMKIGTYPDDKINLKNTKRVFYDVYQAYDVDRKWKELVELLNIYRYKKL